MTQPRNFSWFVEGKLAGMGHPMEDSIPFLADRGIKTLVNITTTGDGYYREAAENHGVSVHCIDVPDFCPPSMEQIEEFLSVVDNAKTVKSNFFFSSSSSSSLSSPTPPFHPPAPSSSPLLLLLLLLHTLLSSILSHLCYSVSSSPFIFFNSFLLVSDD